MDEGEHVRARRHLDRRRVDTINASRRISFTYGASLSPDARYIVFDRPDTETRLRDIFIVDLEDGRETPLIHHESSDHTPAWTKDGRYVLFLSDRSGTTGLWAQRVDTGRAVGLPVRLEPTLGWAFPMGRTTDSGAYYFRRQIGTRDVYVVDFDASGSITGEPARVSIEVAGANGASDWSPDGTKLTFFRRRDDRWSLVIKSMVDGREREISNPHVLGIGRPRWESDGHTILIKCNYRERDGLHRVNVDTGEISMVTTALFRHYEVVPNSREIIYNVPPHTFYRLDVLTGVQSKVHAAEQPWVITGMAISPGWRPTRLQRQPRQRLQGAGALPGRPAEPREGDRGVSRARARADRGLHVDAR